MNYTQEENQYFEWLFRLCDLDHDGRISASDRIHLLKKSGLSGRQLDQVSRIGVLPATTLWLQVWEAGCKASSIPRNMDVPAFFVAMRLVAAAQAGTDLTGTAPEQITSSFRGASLLSH